MVVLAEYPPPFNQNEVPYALPLLNRAMINLGFAPQTLIADAAFDAWSVYQWVVELGGRAAIALNQPGNSVILLGPHDYPLCRCNGQEMQPKSCWIEATHRLQRFVCPDCQTIRNMTMEPGNIFRWRLDRQADLFKQLYQQRTAIDRLNSRAEALNIDQPRQRTARPSAPRHTLIFCVLNRRLLRHYHERQPCPQFLDKAA